MINFYSRKFRIENISKSEICIFFGVLISVSLSIKNYMTNRDSILFLFVLCHVFVPMIIIYINYKTSYYLNPLMSTLDKIVAMPFFTFRYSCHFSEIKEIQYEEFTKRLVFIRNRSSLIKFCVHRNENEIQELIKLIGSSFHLIPFVFINGIGVRQKVVKEKSFIIVNK